MRARVWLSNLMLVAFAVACGDQPTEVVPERDGEVQGVGTVALATSSTEDGLVITTDKDDYAPGDTVWFTGSGWPAEDTLDIVLEDEPITHPPHEWWVPVGGSGTFRDSTYVVDVGDLGVTFTLTATSRATGRSLSVMFTDGNLTSLALNPSTRSVPSTGSAAYSIDVGITGNSNNCTVTLSVLASPALPAGAVSSIPSNVVSTNASFSRTLTITSTGVTPGSYPFTVQAARGSNCQGNGNLTVNGTLVVFGPATTLAFDQQPTDEDATVTITPSVTVRLLDANGNLVVNSTAPVTMAIGTNAGSGSLSGTLIQNAVAGVASFPNLSINKVGTGYRLAATSGSLTGATSGLFNITLGPAAQLGFTSQPSGGAPNTAFSVQPTVEVRDAGGNRKTNGSGSGASISLAIIAGTGASGAVLTCTTNPLGATAGLAGFAGCRINLAGSGYRLRATTSISGNSFSVDSDPFNVAVTNQAPTVDAGGPYTIAEGSELTLSPTVGDANNDPLTYLWTVNTTGIDASGACTFVDATEKNAKLTCTDDSQGAPGGKFTLTLTANDGSGPVPDNADLTVSNATPTAVAGGPYPGNEGAAIQLGGSGDDPGNNDDPQLGYQWTAVTTGIDAGGACTFDNAASKNAKVTCTDDGAFKVRLVVSDDDGGSSVASEADLSVANAAPTANAGGPYSGDEGSAIELGGSGNDPGDNDDSSLTYQWTAVVTGIDPGGACTFDDATSATAKVTCTDDGAFKVRLVVSDDDGGSSVFNEANLTVANAGPAANAGGPYNGNEGAPVKLEGTVTDAGSNDTHVWLWKYVDGTGIDGGTCSFDNANVEDPTITCTDDGTVQLTLKVTDDDGANSEDTATLTLANVNPEADAGGSYSGSEGSPVSLDGSVTDAGSNDTHTWAWQYVGTSVDPGASCDISNPLAEDPTITCTDDGTIQLTLTVTDDDGGSDSDQATLTLTNVNPVATAGGPYPGNEGAAVQLTGTATDAGINDVLTRQWTATPVSGVDAGASCSFLPGPTALSPTITCTDDGTFKVTLTVSDDDGGSDAADGTLTLANVDPVAVAGGPYAGDEGAAVQLTGLESDAGSNDALNRQWTYTAVTGVDAGATCSFGPGPSTLSPSVTCTDDGVYKLTLTVTDDDGGSGSSDASFTVGNLNPLIATPLTKPDGSALPTTLIVAGTLNLRAAFGDAGSNDTHVGAIQCEAGLAFSGLGSVASPFDTGCTFSTVGPKTITVRVTDDDGGVDIETHTLTVKYNFSGFFAPVDRPNTMNLSKAGQAIPLKWRLTDANNAPVTNLAAVTVQAANFSCALGTTADNLEEYAAGASGLQNLGDGYYQFNWKTPTGYAGSCKSTKLAFGSGALSYVEEPAAYFSFRK